MKRIKQSDRDGALRNSLSSSSKSEFSSLGFAKPCGNYEKIKLLGVVAGQEVNIIGIGLRGFPVWGFLPLMFSSVFPSMIRLQRPPHSNERAAALGEIWTLLPRWSTRGFRTWIHHTRLSTKVQIDMGVNPKIGGKPPRSSILIGFSIINHPFWGTSIFGNIHIKKIHSGKQTARNGKFDGWNTIISFWGV